MQYHDDGERGLGPFVASISLGSDALMSFRRKETKKRSRARKAVDESKESSVAPSTSESQAGDEARETPIPTLDGVKKSRSTTQRTALKIRLKHGDVMLMEVSLIGSNSSPKQPLTWCLRADLALQGEEMQRQFEHKVEPEGLRFGTSGAPFMFFSVYEADEVLLVKLPRLASSVRTIFSRHRAPPQLGDLPRRRNRLRWQSPECRVASLIRTRLRRPIRRPTTLPSRLRSPVGRCRPFRPCLRPHVRPSRPAPASRRRL